MHQGTEPIYTILRGTQHTGQLLHIAGIIPPLCTNDRRECTGRKKYSGVNVHSPTYVSLQMNHCIY